MLRGQPVDRLPFFLLNGFANGIIWVIMDEVGELLKIIVKMIT